jgi:integrase/recombinase XerC
MPSNHTTPPNYVAQWLAFLANQRRYSRHTVLAYQRDIQHLIELMSNPSKGFAMTPIENVGVQHIRQCLAKLHAQGYQPRSLARMLAAWRGFYEWLGTQINLPTNPAADVKAPKITRSLPKALSVDQIQGLLDQTTPNTPAYVRDRAMFELLYSSGLRLSELVSLDIHYVKQPEHTSLSWVDLPSADVHVTGKGNKPRTVPIGAQAIKAIQAWLTVRPSMTSDSLNDPDHFALFVGERGKRIHPRVVQQRLRNWSVLAGSHTPLHPHVLRHSFASHVLQSAQDLRAVQDMLGHASISTTQVYTQLDFQHLAKVYDTAHPRAARKPELNSKQADV